MKTDVVARPVATWARPCTAALALAGVGVSAYLTIEHVTGSNALACPETATVNCLRVTTSPQSTIAGIPLAILGLAYFVAMAVSTLPALWRSPRPWLRWGRLGTAALGAVFVVYLIYVELFVVDAVCLWCTAAHVLAVGLFGVLAFHAALAGE